LKKIVSEKIWQHGFMEAFADAVGVRAFGFGARVVDVLDREIELANGRATLRAKFASSIPRARHSQQSWPWPAEPKDWLKFKNPEAPAVRREAEEDWGR
jgi:hypothetical protein